MQRGEMLDLGAVLLGLMFAVETLFGTMYFEPPSATASLRAVISAVLLTVPLTRRRLGTRVAGAIPPLMVLALVGGSLLDGGLAAPMVLAAPLAPLTATFFSSRRAGHLAGAGAALILLLLWFLHSQGLITLPPGGATVHELREVLLVLLVTIGCTVALCDRYEILQEERADWLHERQRLYRLATSGPFDAVYMWNRDGGHWISDNMREWLDRAGSDSLESLIDHRDLDTFRAAWETCARTGQRLELELRLFLGGEGSRWVRIVGEADEPQDDGSGVRNVALLIRDAHARRRLEEHRERLSSWIIHELRTPTAAIIGSLDILTLRQARTPTEQQTLDLALRNAEKLSSLVDDLLDVRKRAEFGLDYDLEKVDIRELVSDVAAENSGLAHRYGVQFRVTDSDTGTAVVDRRRMGQVLSNLLSNAAKYTPRGGVIEIATRRTEDGIRVDVADQGPGVPEDLGDRIFEMYAQGSDAKGRRSGTGLGLHLSHTIVQDLGGRLTFENRVEGGARFALHLDPVEDTAP